MRLTDQKIKVVAFDADDTLWDCQSWFDDVERECGELLKPWATQEEVTKGLFATERGNMAAVRIKRQRAFYMLIPPLIVGGRLPEGGPTFP